MDTEQNPPLTQDDILTSAGTRQWLEKLGHSPRHPLGQNFLTDPNIVQKSVALAQIEAGERVVEIGPGLGTLTIGLLAAGADVWAVEFDPVLFRHLEEHLVPRAQNRLHLLKGDAVDFPAAGFPDSSEKQKPFKVVANLPYAIATPWMEALLRQPNLPERMVLMLQRESAERFTAEPGTKSRGAISIYLEAAYEKDKGHAVSRQSFHPAPGVDSVLLNLKRRHMCDPFAQATKNFIRHFFTQRRKQIGALCRKHEAAALLQGWLEAAGIDYRLRPEALTLAQWKALDNAVRAHGEIQNG